MSHILMHECHKEAVKPHAKASGTKIAEDQPRGRKRKTHARENPEAHDAPRKQKEAKQYENGVKDGVCKL